ncbi:DUF294 nucleotidyltransferase-like domain-containing protein [Paenibacillus sp. J5C_2022]|uniref:DUF294 nucleotidyltransferase-like domain-containing protein n=1 Tax=Paenibacillus sp. J5C2022 TaxID=2977129 RepID=UPI0021CEF072|nr:DUF294 nucleotidyltransferase-like domain-containing protein [Paenibacillus sp. J5C2022]MCU6707616.1 DUF294 nucleotidyltransferase-like domain-containing protein [Paenibacillus sp. J5C2022]
MLDSVNALLQQRMARARDAGELLELRRLMHNEMERHSYLSIDMLNEQMNAMHDRLIGRAIVLAEKELARKGRGTPPVPYAYVLFGSGGRKEQTWSSDQDSGIIYEHHDYDMDATQAYFLALGEEIVDTLSQTGYPPCEGNVLSSNALWCKSVQQWHSTISLWCVDPTWEAIRYLLIVADGRSVYGEERLWSQLKERYLNAVLSYAKVPTRMLENTMRHKVLTGIFGQLLTDRYGEDAGSLDMKYGAYIPMVNAVRLLAIRAGIVETSTLGRILQLIECGELSESEGKGYLDAFRFFMRMRLMAKTQFADGYYSSSGKLPRSILDKEQVSELRSFLKQGRRLQRFVNRLKDR